MSEAYLGRSDTFFDLIKTLTEAFVVDTVIVRSLKLCMILASIELVHNRFDDFGLIVFFFFFSAFIILKSEQSF